MALDRDRAQQAVSELLTALGDDPKRPGLADTPRHVVEALASFFSGVDAEPASLITELEPAPAGAEPVVLTNISVRSLCEHHLMPFTGVAHVAYVPGAQLVTLGSLSRVVESAAAKPQIQERLGDEIASILEAGVGAAGVLVVLNMSHQCVTARSNNADARTVTIASRGVLGSGAARAEILALLGSNEVRADG